MRPRGAASRWWLHHSLQALDASLRALGSRLILRRGAAEQVIGRSRCRSATPQAVYWNRIYDQGTRERDARLKQAFTARGVAAESLKANLLFEPWEVQTQGGGRSRSSPPFWRACRGLASPRAAAAGAAQPASDQAPGRRATRSPRGACCRPRPTGQVVSAPRGRQARPPPFTRLTSFLDDALATLPRGARPAGHRRHLAAVAASRLRRDQHRGRSGGPRPRAAISAATDKFLAELGWREFAYSLLFHFGDLAQRNFRPEFDRLPLARRGRRDRGVAARPHRLSRSSTPACASSGRPAGCTTACA